MKRVSILSLLLLLLPYSSPSAVTEIWALTKNPGAIFRYEAASGGVLGAPIFIHDVNNDGDPDVPSAIVASNSSLAPGTHAFVAQEQFLTVIDSFNGFVLRSVNIQQLLGPPGLEVRGLAAAPARLFKQGNTRIQKSYLVLAANVPGPGGLDGWLIVLDQECLVDLGCFPTPVAAGLLAPGAELLDVSAKELPEGSQLQRLDFTFRCQGCFDAPANVWSVGVLTAGVREDLPFQLAVSDVETFKLTGSNPPDRLTLGTSPSRNFEALPLGDRGEIRAMNTGRTCNFGGDVRQVLVAGPGQRSDTIFALDRATDELVFVDPFSPSCRGTSITVGTDPVDMVTVGQIEWEAVYVANAGSNSLTRVADNLSSFNISVPGEPVGVARLGALLCSVDPEETTVSVSSFSLDGSGAGTLRIRAVPRACPVGKEFTFWCSDTGTHDATSPCHCQCPQDHGPQVGDCLCPGEDAFPSPLGPGGGFDELYGGNELNRQNPWKRLGIVASEPPGEVVYDHDFGPTTDPDWVYGVTLEDDQPPEVP